MNKQWPALLLPWLPAVLLLWLVTAVSGGAGFVVNDPADAGDALPGDGVCETAVGNGVCTLRAAVQESNALPGHDTIQLPAGAFTLTIPGRLEDAALTGDLDLLDSVTLQGAGQEATFVDGGDVDRVFHIQTPVTGTVAFADLSIRNGRPDFDPGGGIYLETGQATLTAVTIRDTFAGEGGGIYAGGPLTVTDSLLTNNTAPKGGAFYIDPNGELNLRDTAVISNGAGHGGGFYLDQEGGAFPLLSIRGATIAGNGATFGGGMYLLVSRLTLHGSAIRGNAAAGAGGGIYAASAIITVTETTLVENVVNSFQGNGGGISGMGTTLTLVDSAVYSNSVMLSDSDGGGLSIFGWSTIENTTFSGNSAGRGGAIRYGIGRHTVTNSTIAGNSAVSSGGGLYDDPVYFGEVTLYNNIVAGNGGGNCGDNGQLFSTGHNLDDGATCPFTAPGDLLNTDPLLGPLRDNGGPTWTRALIPDSPAVDTGGDPGCPPADQRGAPRPADGDGDGTAVCDRGAFEAAALDPPPTPTPTPTATAVPPPSTLYLPVLIAP